MWKVVFRNLNEDWSRRPIQITYVGRPIVFYKRTEELYALTSIMQWMGKRLVSLESIGS